MDLGHAFDETWDKYAERLEKEYGITPTKFQEAKYKFGKMLDIGFTESRPDKEAEALGLDTASSVDEWTNKLLEALFGSKPLRTTGFEYDTIQQMAEETREFTYKNIWFDGEAFKEFTTSNGKKFKPQIYVAQKEGYKFNNVIDAIKSGDNDAIKESTKRFVFQFGAGRNKDTNEMSQYFTKYSTVPWIVLNQLSEGLGILGLSAASKSSSGAILFNLLAKRALPVYAALQIPGMINYFSEPIFGKDEDGNPLSEEEIKRRKAEAKKKEKEQAKENDTRSLSEKAEDSLNGLLTGLKEVVPAVIPDNVKDKLKEHGIGRSEEDIENGVGSDSLIGKVTGLSSFKNLKSSLKEKLTGAKDKALGMIDKAEDKGKSISKKAQDKAEGIASDVQDAVVQNRYSKMGKEKSFEYVNNKLNALANTAETGVQNAGDDQKAQESAQYDQMTVQNISALVQSAGVNGSYSEQEISNITTAINGVNNKSIKQQLRKFVLPMLKQNKTKSKSDIAYDENNKGPGLIKRIVKYSGLLFKPLTKILGSGLKVLMGMSGVLLKIGGTLIKSGVKDVRYGVRSLREGIFGSKREGEESLGLVRRVV